jgi:hypothetical protein
MNPIEIRYRLESRPYTLRQRLSMWWNGVTDAYFTAPPKTYFDYIPVKPEDPGYAEAPLAYEIVKGPRFTLRDGKLERIEEPVAPITPNPAYYTPTSK